MTSTNSVLFPLCNGQLTLGHTFSLPTFVNMLVCRFHEVFLPSEEELMWTFYADYINHNNHRKHEKQRTMAYLCQCAYSVAFEMVAMSDGFSKRGCHVLSGLIYHGEML